MQIEQIMNLEKKQFQVGPKLKTKAKWLPVSRSLSQCIPVLALQLGPAWLWLAAGLEKKGGKYIEEGGKYIPPPKF